MKDVDNVTFWFESEQNTLQWQSFTVIQSTLLEHGDFNRGCDRTLSNGGIFTHYPVNTSENGDFNKGHKGYLTGLFNLTRVAKQTNRSCTYIGVDSQYSFLHYCSSVVTSLAYP